MGENKRLCRMNFDRVKFWTDPTKADDELRKIDNGRMVRFCQPDFYLNHTWGQQIIKTAFKYMDKEWSILELGCNTGKTLAFLKENGFHNLMGVEINQKAIDLGKKKFPLLKDVEIICMPLENVIGHMKQFDVIYAGGVYMHLPYKLDWVFYEISNHAKEMILTAENEANTDFYRFARNYKEIFEGYGWIQVEEENGVNFPPLPETTIKRIFMK